MKIEPHGVAGTYLHEHVRVGDSLEVGTPRGSFILLPGERPLVLLSAEIGVTPVLAMLYALESARSTRQVLWLHAARDGEHHPFAVEAHRLVQALAHGRSFICYSQPLIERQSRHRLRCHRPPVPIDSRSDRSSAKRTSISAARIASWTT